MALADVPGLGAYLEKRRMNEARPLQELQQAQAAVGLMGALRQQQLAEQEMAREKQVRGALANTNGDPEKAMAILIQSGNVAGAAKLAPLVEARRKATHVLTPGAQLVTNEGGVVASVPPRPAEDPEIVRLQKYLSTLPEGDPGRGPVQKRIQMLGERQGGVNVYSGTPTAGVDAQGNPVFFQPSAQPGVPPKIIPGVRPQPKPKDEAGLTPENAGKVAMAQQAIAGVGTVRGLLFDKSGNLNRGLVMAMSIPGTTGLPGNTNARVARSAIRNAVEAKLRLETGAAATQSEIDRTLDRFLPTVGDTPQSAAFKLGELENFFQMSLAQTKGMKSDKPGGAQRLKFDAQGNPVQ